MPTGTGDKWSGRGKPATKDYSFLPLHAESGLNETTRRKKGNSLFLQDGLNKGLFLFHLTGVLQIS